MSSTQLDRNTEHLTWFKKMYAGNFLISDISKIN